MPQERVLCWMERIHIGHYHQYEQIPQELLSRIDGELFMMHTKLLHLLHILIVGTAEAEIVSNLLE